jgi:hypothetical protein
MMGIRRTSAGWSVYDGFGKYLATYRGVGCKRRAITRAGTNREV